MTPPPVASPQHKTPSHALDVLQDEIDAAYERDCAMVAHMRLRVDAPIPVTAPAPTKPTPALATQRRTRVSRKDWTRRPTPEEAVNRYNAVNLDLSDEAVEFGKAMEAYKTRTGMLHPGSAQALEVLQQLGYTRPRPVKIEAIVYARRVDDYKQHVGKRFLLWSEYLAVAVSMGYHKAPVSCPR